MSYGEVCVKFLNLELYTVIGSGLLLPLWLFLNLCRLIISDLILKLNLLITRMDIPSFKNYEKLQ